MGKIAIANLNTIQYNFNGLIEELNATQSFVVNGINKYTNSIEFIFDREMGISEMGVFDAVILAHNPNNYINKHFVLNGLNSDPSHIDYDILELYKNKTYLKGRLISMEHYINYDSNTNTFSNLALKEELVHHYSPYRLIIRTEKIISWYHGDGMVGKIKTMNKFYTTVEAIKYEEDVREYLTNEAKLYIWMNLSEANSFYILNLLDSYINLYIRGSKSQLVNWWINTTDPLVTEPLRAGILSIINI